MSYADEGNAGYRITSFVHNVSTILGMVRCVIEKLINREIVAADDNNVPISRPINEIDARATIDMLAMDDAISESAAASNGVLNFSEANGSGSGDVTVGPLLGGTVVNQAGRNQGGFNAQQTFEMEGTSLTYTVSM